MRARCMLALCDGHAPPRSIEDFHDLYHDSRRMGEFDDEFEFMACQTCGQRCQTFTGFDDPASSITSLGSCWTGTRWYCPSEALDLLFVRDITFTYFLFFNISL